VLFVSFVSSARYTQKYQNTAGLWFWILFGQWHVPHIQQMLHAHTPRVSRLSFVPWQTINACSLSTVLQR
jgi:hypothetical protein